MASRLRSVATTIWTHKKKSAAAGVALIYLADKAQTWNTNNRIRAYYARLAAEYGSGAIGFHENPRRVTVLANSSANERGSYDDFTKNALPLLHLAGLAVNVIKAENAQQLENLAAALDSQEADAIYVVGGDGTLKHAMTGIARRQDAVVPLLPVGVFPGGWHNRALRLVAPSVFFGGRGAAGDGYVGAQCESAMAVIEQTKRRVALISWREEGENAAPPQFGLTDAGAGWFRHCDERTRALWYWARLRRRVAYLWEMVKRSPKPLEMELELETWCSGCQKCRTAVAANAQLLVDNNNKRWWHWLIGRPRPTAYASVQQIDYSQIQNEECGKLERIQCTSTDLVVDNEQIGDTNALRVRVGGPSSLGRIGVISDGWRRSKEDSSTHSANPEFYDTDRRARSLLVTFRSIPAFLNRVYFCGDSQSVIVKEEQTEEAEEEKAKPDESAPKLRAFRIRAEGGRLVDMFVPNGIRVDPANC